MRLLINASNLKQGGGVQVADSICQYLDRYPDFYFEVVLPPIMENTIKIVSGFPNVSVTVYSIRDTVGSILFQRDSVLDSLVKNRQIDAVLTVFGPSRWRPSVPHLSGFARAQLLPMDTPFFKTISIREQIRNKFIRWSFSRCADNYWTENPSISNLLKKAFPKKKIFTVSNNYNQIFDNKTLWKEHLLSPFRGITLLTVTNAYPHKNLALAIRL